MYDSTLNAWSPTSEVGAPEPRQASSAVWDGEGMIVWGGFVRINQPYDRYLSTGGSFVPPDPNDSFDADQDGFSHCAGDCNESNPAAYPGAAAACDARDDDCDGVLPGGIDLPGNQMDEDCDGATLCDPGAQWPNHHTHVKCVSSACRSLVDTAQVYRLEP